MRTLQTHEAIEITSLFDDAVNQGDTEWAMYLFGIIAEDQHKIHDYLYESRGFQAGYEYNKIMEKALSPYLQQLSTLFGDNNAMHFNVPNMKDNKYYPHKSYVEEIKNQKKEKE